MNYCNILDSNRLINLKNRNGLAIATRSTISIYSSQSRLRRNLFTSLLPFFNHKNDLQNMIDRIVDRCEEPEQIESVTAYFLSTDHDLFIAEASGKIKTFFKTVKAFNQASELTEYVNLPKFSA